MVTVAVEAPSAAPVALLSLTAKVSSGSAALSFLIGTSIDFGLASPLSQLSVPLRVVKSLFDLALPGAVANLTDALPSLPPARSTVTVTTPAASFTV